MATINGNPNNQSGNAVQSVMPQNFTQYLNEGYVAGYIADIPPPRPIADIPAPNAIEDFPLSSSIDGASSSSLADLPAPHAIADIPAPNPIADFGPPPPVPGVVDTSMVLPAPFTETEKKILDQAVALLNQGYSPEYVDAWLGAQPPITEGGGGGGGDAGGGGKGRGGGGGEENSGHWVFPPTPQDLDRYLVEQAKTKLKAGQSPESVDNWLRSMGVDPAMLDDSLADDVTLAQQPLYGQARTRIEAGEPRDSVDAWLVSQGLSPERLNDDFVAHAQDMLAQGQSHDEVVAWLESRGVPNAAARLDGPPAEPLPIAVPAPPPPAPPSDGEGRGK